MSNEEKKSDATAVNHKVRIISNKDNIIAFNFLDNLDIRVVARRFNDRVQPNMWKVSVEANGMLRLAGSIFGGKSVVNALVRSLRSGMTSRQMKHRRATANHRARKAKEIK